MARILSETPITYSFTFFFYFVKNHSRNWPWSSNCEVTREKIIPILLHKAHKFLDKKKCIPICAANVMLDIYSTLT